MPNVELVCVSDCWLKSKIDLHRITYMYNIHKFVDARMRMRM